MPVESRGGSQSAGQREALVKSDLVDLEMKIHGESQAAVLASDDGEKTKAVWLPKSQIEIEPTQSGTYIVTMPAWLAEEKDLA